MSGTSAADFDEHPILINNFSAGSSRSLDESRRKYYPEGTMTW